MGSRADGRAGDAELRTFAPARSSCNSRRMGDLPADLPGRRYFFEDDAHERLRQAARRFASREIAPYAAAWDEAGEFPRALYAAAAQAGVLGITFPEELGGTGGDLGHAMVVGEEIILAGQSVGTAAGLGSLAIAVPPIVHAGSEA